MKKMLLAAFMLVMAGNSFAQTTADTLAYGFTGTQNLSLSTFFLELTIFFSATTKLS